MGKRCSIACIIPPVLLEELARRGTDDERDAALRTLSLDATLRLARTHNALVGAPVNRTTVLQSITAGQPQRTIYDCHEQEPVTNPEVVRSEGGAPTDDPAVNEAYDGLGATYNFYWDQFKRDSIDDQGMPCTAGCTTATPMTTPSGTARRWCSETASPLPASPSRST